MALPESLLHHVDRIRNAAFDEARAQAVTALAGQREHVDELLPHLVKALGDPGAVVLVAAARALGSFGAHAAAATPGLRRHLEHEDPLVREAVAQALQRLAGS